MSSRTIVTRIGLGLGAITVTAALSACGILPTDSESSSPVATTSEAIATATESVDIATAAPADAQTQALNDYVDASQPQVEQLRQQYADTYADIQVLAIGRDTVEYDYLYAAQVDPASAVSTFDGQIDAFQQAVDQQLIPDMVANGITEAPKVTYNYFNADGTFLWGHTFESSVG